MKYQNINIEHMANTGHKVVKMGAKLSAHHGMTWFECKDCDWRTAEELTGDKLLYDPILDAQI